MKILNLYAGIGGNRKLWQDVDVTAVELNPNIAAVYQHFFPNDKLVIDDAHEYLLRHYEEFDFIWASPPCQTHSDMGKLAYLSGKKDAFYPDMKLYQEIIFLQTFAKDRKWVVENTESYYKPLIKPQHVGKHYFWANFHISAYKLVWRGITTKKQYVNNEIRQRMKGFDLTGLSTGHRKDQVLNNCTEPDLGLHILNCATKGGQLQLLSALPSAPLQEG